MKVQVIATGLSGLIGTRFQQLFHDTYNFLNLDLTTGIDITNPLAVEKAIGESRGEVVLHLAAYTNVAEANKQKDDKTGVCYQINVAGTKNVAQSCLRFDKYLIHISTDFVFDGTKESPYTEADSPHPIDWYGITKLLAEQEVQKGGDNHVILRLAFPYQQHPIRPDLVNKLITQLKDKTLPPQFTDNFITPTFVDDVCQVFDYCITHRPTGIYHTTGSSWHSSYEIAQMVKETFKLDGEINQTTVAAFTQSTGRPFPKNLKMDNKKIEKGLGLSLKSFAQGLENVKTS